MSQDVEPDEIVVDREARVLEVTWRDGPVSRIPFDLLRKACPCARCQEDHAAPDPLRILGPGAPRAGRLDIESMTPVGRYGISFRFSDGHAFGIYTFERLRELGS